MVALTGLILPITSQPEKGQLPQLKSTWGLAPTLGPMSFSPILIGVGGFHLETWGKNSYF